MHSLALSDNADDASKGDGSTVFHHDGDYSGDVEIIREDSSGAQARVWIPFWQLRRLVAEYVRTEKIGQLENATDRELLGLPTPPRRS